MEGFEVSAMWLLEVLCLETCKRPTKIKAICVYVRPLLYNRPVAPLPRPTPPLHPLSKEALEEQYTILSHRHRISPPTTTLLQHRPVDTQSGLCDWSSS